MVLLILVRFVSQQVELSQVRAPFFVHDTAKKPDRGESARLRTPSLVSGPDPWARSARTIATVLASRARREQPALSGNARATAQASLPEVAVPVSEVESWLQSAGIGVAKSFVCDTESVLDLQQFEALGVPIVIKGIGSTVGHKASRGLVTIGVRDHHLGQAIAGDYLQRAGVEMVQVQEQVGASDEVFIAIWDDSTFGPVLVTGSGGRDVERLGDITYGLLPSTSDEAIHQLGIETVAQGAVFGVGAYSSAIFIMHTGLSMNATTLLAALLIAVVTGAVAGLLTAIPGLRLQRDTFIISSLAIQYLIGIIFTNWISVTGGPSGLFGIIYSGSGLELTVWIVCALAIVIVGLKLGLAFTPYGRRILAVRDDEALASSVGIRGTRVKVSLFLVSGALAGMAGFFFVLLETAISPSSFSLETGFMILSMAIIGGSGSIYGAAFGGILIIGVGQLLANVSSSTEAPAIEGVVYGAILVAVMFLRPAGLFPRRMRKHMEWSWAGLKPRSRTHTGPEKQATPPNQTRGKLAIHDHGSPVGGAQELGRHAEENASINGNERFGLPALVVEDVSNNFGGVRALRSVSFSLDPSELLLIIGANGAGKSTLVDVISGAIRPDAGSVRFPASERADGTNGCVVARSFQSARLWDGMTVLETFIAVLEVGRIRIRNQFKADRVQRVVDQLPQLSQLLPLRCDSLSSGQRKLVSIGICLLREPDITVLDEPTATLDAPAAAELMEVVMTLPQTGTAVIVVEHNLAASRCIGADTLVMAQGNGIARGSLDEVLQVPAVIKAYMGSADTYA